MKTVMTKTTCSLGVLLTSLTALLLGCTSQPSGRYQQAHDSAPTRMPTAAELQSATPIQEPLSRQGNQDYQVNGVFYDVMDTAKGYSERGIASWYGNKFHGHLTSNGEYYDMYSMTAAHTRLPLPTYVRVTNLDNQKHVIVRVNDRGPFHSERLIDLSFAAAYKLDMIDNGTAPVKVEAIEFLSPAVEHRYYVQLFASEDAEKIASLREQLPESWQSHATTQSKESLHKLLLGPLPQVEANKWLQQVRTEGFPNAFRVKITANTAEATDSNRQN